MVVQHNITAMNSNRMLGLTQKTLSSSTEKLSSGYAINRAADNAAGLAISEKMRKQIRGLTQASTNAEDGISAVQTAEGALTEVHDMLQRMNELAVQAANGTNSEDDRSYIQDEIDQLTQEIDRVAETTKFNEIYLLKGDTTNEAGMGYSYSYKTVGSSLATVATASFVSATSTSQGLSVTISFASCSTTVSSSDSNTLASLLKSQGFTITANTVTIKGSDGKETLSIEYTLTLNGSDANSNYTVITTSATGGNFQIVNSSNQVVATVTIDDLYNNNGTITSTVAASRTQNVTAYAATAALAESDVICLYDKDGNAISANKLNEYFTAIGGTKAGDSGTIYANAGIKLYDALGNAYSTASLYAFASNNINAIKDQTATLKLSFQVGADGTSNNKITINIDAMSAKSLGINGLKVDGEDDTNATNAIETIAAAIKKVSEQRSALGAVQNRLDHTINNLDNIVENTTDAEASIRDTDMATEMVTYSNANILAQAGQSMLAQANQSNQGVLSLLG